MKIILAVLVGLLALVALGSGLSGALLGARDITDPTFAHDSNYRFLSVFLAGAGAVLVWSLWRLPEAGTEIRVVAALVFLGGLARLLSLATAGRPSAMYIFYLAAELVLPPAIVLLQAAVARAE